MADHAGATASTGTALDFCVKCRYSLRGRPAPDGNCPECGTEYHGDDWVWQKKRTSRYSRWRLLGEGLLAACAFGLLAIHPPFGITIGGAYFSTGVLFGALGVVVLLTTLARYRDRRGRFVAITRAGVHLVDLAPEFYDWSRISKIDRSDSAILIAHRFGMPPLVVDRRFLDEQDFDDFVARAEAAKARVSPVLIRPVSD